MMKFNLEKYAKEHAFKNNLYYGFSVFSISWYVGTKCELKQIGVFDILHPQTSLI
jgi:hypothetical protein